MRKRFGLAFAILVVVAAALLTQPEPAKAAREDGYVRSYTGGRSSVDLYCHEGTLIVVSPALWATTGVGGSSVALEPKSLACK